MLNFSGKIIGIVVLLVAAPLYAQTRSDARRTFLDVPVGPNWDDVYGDTTRVAGATWESGLALGFDSGKSGFELDVSVPQWHVRSNAPDRFHYVGPSFGYEQTGHFYESTSTERHRSIDVTVLHRTNVAITRHATFTWLLGGGFIYRPSQFTSVTRDILPNGQLTEVNRFSNMSDRNYLAATTRFDLAFRVSSRLSVVPRLRVTIFPSLLDDSALAPRILVARPEIAVRWRL